MHTDFPTSPEPRDGFATRPLLANPAAEAKRLQARAAWQETASPSETFLNPNESPAWAAEALRLDERETERREARAVKLVDIDLPLSSVFALYVQVAIIQLLVAAVVVVALLAFGVI